MLRDNRRAEVCREIPRPVLDSSKPERKRFKFKTRMKRKKRLVGAAGPVGVSAGRRCSGSP